MQLISQLDYHHQELQELTAFSGSKNPFVFVLQQQLSKSLALLIDATRVHTVSPNLGGQGRGASLWREKLRDAHAEASTLVNREPFN